MLGWAMIDGTVESIVEGWTYNIFLALHGRKGSLLVLYRNGGACAYFGWDFGRIERRICLLLVLLLKHFLKLSHFLGVTAFAQELQRRCLSPRVFSISG